MRPHSLRRLASLPPRSSGVLAAALGELTVVYDLVTEMVHVLNPMAGDVWRGCDGVTDIEAVIERIAAATGAEPSAVAAEVTAYLDRLTEAGVVSRMVALPEPTTIDRASVDGAVHGVVHAVLDEGVRFRGEDDELVRAIDDLLGFDDQRPATVDVGVSEDADGTVGLRGWGAERTFGSRAALLDSLPTFLNQIAAASSTCIALHAGAVRTADAGVILLPAVSGSGKTTLVAALVRSGWDYASDEAVGVRAGSLTAVAYPKPLVLDARSRGLLGLAPSGSPNTAVAELRTDVEVIRGDAGRITRVVLPRYEPGAEASLVTLTPRDAIVGILEHALNLRRVGQPGLDALCQLAEQVPVHRLVHGGIESAVPAIESLA